MSFVKKAIKKVVKTVKKIVKSDVFKWVAIAATVFFTAGVAAAGGFAAFGTSMTAAGGGLTGFFSAVGQTIATGAASIAGSLGFQGASTGIANTFGGTMAAQAGLGTLAPVTVSASKIGAAYLGGSVSSVTAGTAGNVAGSGFLASVKGVLGKKVLGDVSIGQLAASGITTAMTETLKAKAGEQEKTNAFVAGGLAYGGGEEAPGAISYDVGGSPPAPSAASPEPTTPQGVVEQEPTVAAQLAQGGEAQPSPANRIQALIQARGPISQPGYGGTSPQMAGGLLPQQGPMATGDMNIQMQPGQAPPDRRFLDEPARLQYSTGGLV